MRCFLSIGLRRFTGLAGCQLCRPAGRLFDGNSEYWRCAGRETGRPLVGGGRRGQSAIGSVVPLAEFTPNSATLPERERPECYADSTEVLSTS